MKPKWWLSILFLLVFIVSRIPGLLPPNFSAVYALLFCAGVYFREGKSWLLPLAALVCSDLFLSWWYHYKYGFTTFSLTNLHHVALNYLAFLLIFLLGRMFKPRHSFTQLVGGGVLGALVFFVVSNTFVWFLNPFNAPEYTRDFRGWLWALTIGTAGWPETWTFFKNTLLSGGLFTGLFVGVAKLVEALETEPETEAAEEPVEADPAPEKVSK